MSDDMLREVRELFLLEAGELLARSEQLLLSLEKEGVDHSGTFADLKRVAHNLKGSGKAVGFDGISRFCHSMENLLVRLASGDLPLTRPRIDLLLGCNDRLKVDVEVLKQNPEAELNYSTLLALIDEELVKKEVPESAPAADAAPTSRPAFAAAAPRAAPPSSEDTIRVPLRKIDELLSSFGEQVISLSALDHYQDDIEAHQDEIRRTIFNLKKLAYDLQHFTLTLRMVSLKALYSKMERSIRDSAVATGKAVDLDLQGAHLELDKAIADQLSDPLNHIVRNAVDHGLEAPEEREASGKPRKGRVSLVARREGGRFILEIRDDGKGLDPAKIRAKAIEKGLIRADAALSEKEIFDLIFENGFSTKEQVSEISGRGVGMNVVKEAVASLKGTCEIESRVGEGTCFRIGLPLSLSLFNGLLVEISGGKYIVPSSQVVEIVSRAEVEVRQSQPGRHVFQLRREIYDLVPLPDLLGAKRRAAAEQEKTESTRHMILLVDIAGRRVGFLIHRLCGIHRVVQKPLSPEMKVCPGASGVTILGDGLPAMILDLRQIAGAQRQAGEREKREAAARAA